MSAASELFNKPRPRRWTPQLHEQVFMPGVETASPDYGRGIVWMVLPLDVSLVRYVGIGGKVTERQMPNNHLRPTGLRYDQVTGQYKPLRVRRRSKATSS